MKRSCLIFVWILSAFSNVCSAQQNAKDVLHLAYDKGAQQTLDLYLPQNLNNKTPVIIMLHGGAWVMGGNQYTEKTSKDLRDRGFVIANVDYRYVSDSVHGTQLLQDIDHAVSYVQSIAKEYGFSNDHYHMAGISAGAHLALLYGYTTKNKIKSITALCPPTQLDSPESPVFLEKNNLVKNVELLADDVYKKATKPGPAFTAVSPYAQIKAIPTLLFHGDSDPLVPYSQSIFLYGQLQAKSITSKFVTMKGKGHDCGMNDHDSELQVLNQIEEWVRKYN